jgi:hypothetical protein
MANPFARRIGSRIFDRDSRRRGAPKAPFPILRSIRSSASRACRSSSLSVILMTLLRYYAAPGWMIRITQPVHKCADHKSGFPSLQQYSDSRAKLEFGPKPQLRRVCAIESSCSLSSNANRFSALTELIDVICPSLEFTYPPADIIDIQFSDFCRMPRGILWSPYSSLNEVCGILTYRTKRFLRSVRAFHDASKIHY